MSFTQQTSAQGKPTWIPDRLPRLDVAHALASVELPLHLNWSAPGRVCDPRSRADRARLYEIVLQEGTPADILTYVDGVLLVDLWEELVLPRGIFLLAGGAALLAQHLTARPTEDLDFFTRPRRGRVPAARDALEAVAG